MDKIEVKIGNKGILLKNNRFIRILENGTYVFLRFLDRYSVIEVPMHMFTEDVASQEVITQDNISLRLSYLITYKIADVRIIMDLFDLHNSFNFTSIKNWSHSASQIEVRNIITNYGSETINQKRHEIKTQVVELLKEKFLKHGLEFIDFDIKDVNFPRDIQDIFAKELESKIRSRVDLDNARTKIATARALKNVATLMHQNPNIKFLHFMEGLEKLSYRNSKNTFVFGDLKSIVDSQK